MKRRTFAKTLSSIAILPVISSMKILELENYQKNDIDKLCGRALTDDEKLWMKKFLAEYDKSMKSVRSISLPIEVFPGFIPKYPEKRPRKK